MSMTMDTLRDLIKQHDYPGRLVLSRADFESVISNLDTKRHPVERGNTGARQFWFGETCVACEPPNDRVVDLTESGKQKAAMERMAGEAWAKLDQAVDKILKDDPPIEIPCHTPDAEWVESPLVTPPAPEVRKGAKRKKASDASEVVG